MLFVSCVSLTSNPVLCYIDSTIAPCRRMLTYFAPPSFRITKDAIKQMGNDELKEFPLVCSLNGMFHIRYLRPKY